MITWDDNITTIKKAQQTIFILWQPVLYLSFPFSVLVGSH